MALLLTLFDVCSSVLLLCVYVCVCVFQWYDSNVADSSTRHQNYVALGSGFPEGETAYVLRLGVSGGAICSKVLINAVTGDSYDLLNARQREACPMQSLSLVFNADNIWANIQHDDDPVHCSFELFNPLLWRPFFYGGGGGAGKSGGAAPGFTKEIAAQQYAMKFDTIQKTIQYTEEPFEYYSARANKIERSAQRNQHTSGQQPTAAKRKRASDSKVTSAHRSFRVVLDCSCVLSPLVAAWLSVVSRSGVHP